MLFLPEIADIFFTSLQLVIWKQITVPVIILFKQKTFLKLGKIIMHIIYTTTFFSLNLRPTVIYVFKKNRY